MSMKVYFLFIWNSIFTVFVTVNFLGLITKFEVFARSISSLSLLFFTSSAVLAKEL